MTPTSTELIHIETERDIPPALPGVIDVVLLDMNHGQPNLGHDSLVHAVLEGAAALGQEMSARVLTIDVRRAPTLPYFDLDRFRLFVGTGGPGHLDPRLNDGVSGWSDGIAENPKWEGPLFELFDRIMANPEVALFGFCHSFGLMCRWSGIAEARERSEDKGGMSAGIVTCELTPEALSHPWFSRFSSALRERRHFRVLDSRWFDLIPTGGGADYIPLAYEWTQKSGRGEALTMVELARDPGGVMPRIFGANHHPEVVDEAHMVEVLGAKVSRGEVSEEWARKKAESITVHWSEPAAEERVRRTSRYTLLEPLEFHLKRIAARRTVTR